MSGLRALIKEIPENSCSFYYLGIVCEPGNGLPVDTKSAGPFILDFTASRTVRNKLPPVSNVLL